MTDAAKAHLQAALAKQPDKKGVRISTKEAGCSGLKYQFGLTEAARPGDLTVTINDIPVFIEAKAEMYLLGAVLDLRKMGLNTELDFINPNEAGRCGCGESFTPKKPAM
jgi:iron-sulfur cluster assembly protein